MPLVLENNLPLVYVVDDDEPVRKSLRRLLKADGFDVLSFASAEDFLEGDRSAVPCCLVLDIRMPGLTGIELQKDLKSRLPDLPIVFITGHGDVPMSVQAMKDGAIDFLEKPFDDVDLVLAIRKAISLHNSRRKYSREITELERRISSLTRRENEVFALVVTGLMNKQIASILGVTEKTIKVHRGRVMQKMEVVSLAELVRAAERAGVIVENIDLLAGKVLQDAATANL